MIVSGGTDSTLMAAYTAKYDQKMGWSPRQRRGYTVQLEHQPKAEAQWAQLLCKQWGWEHELITLKDRHLINAYSRVSERLDEPLGDRSCYQAGHWLKRYNLMNVAIGGDGGDELFLGYSRYLNIAPKLKKLGSNENWASLYWQYALAVGDNEAISHADKALGSILCAYI